MYPGSVIQTVDFPRHAPGHYMTDNIYTTTFDACVSAIKSGKKIYIGNAPQGLGIIAQVNSRYHGKSIRTIRAI